MSLIKRTYHDDLFSRFIRHRDGLVCQYCLKAFPFEKLDCSHLFSRGDKSTRWEEDNAVSGCRPCHDYFGVHKREHREFFIKRLGRDRVEELHRLSKQPAKYQDQPEMRARLRERLRKMGVVLPGERGPVLGWCQPC